VDVKREHIAVAEAQRLDIPVFAMCDTNSNPDLVDFPIPANDDAYKSIALITLAIGKAIEEGLMERKQDKDDARMAEEEEAKRLVDMEVEKEAAKVVAKYEKED
jgi:small subunit ribosomal protein S2